MTRRPPRDDAGTAIVEFVWLAILLLVPLLYIVLAVFDTQRASYAASAAARSASRAFVTSPDQATAYARAEAAARLAFGDQGIEAADFTLVITCRPDPDRCLSPGSVVDAEVRSAADLPLMPAALGSNTPRITVEAIHRSPYGTFREARP
ncbi:Tfp pilus assembly protein PilX [Marmoricola sp. URHA0025 HA25]